MHTKDYLGMTVDVIKLWAVCESRQQSPQLECGGLQKVVIGKMSASRKRNGSRRCAKGSANVVSVGTIWHEKQPQSASAPIRKYRRKVSDSVVGYADKGVQIRAAAKKYHPGSQSFQCDSHRQWLCKASPYCQSR